MAGKGYKQNIAYTAFSPAILLCFMLLAVYCHDMQCRSKYACDNDSVCCESSTGKQWCCERTKRCCSDGCCTIKTSISKSFKHGSDYHLHRRKYLMPGPKPTVDLISLLRHQLNPKDKNQTNFKMCDERGKFYCGDSEICCNFGESWICCPYNQGSSCRDLNDCSPSMTPGDSLECADCKQYEKSSEITERKILKPLPNTETVSDLILCPDLIRICEDTDTCCKVSNFSYGCCPYEDAVCCSDLLHCCPPDTECNTEMLTCEPVQKVTERNFRYLPLRFLNVHTGNLQEINNLTEKNDIQE